MDLVQILQGLIASLQGASDQIVALQAQLADAQVSADALAKSKFDEGFAAGVASVLPNVDKIYSQAELDQKVSEAVLPLQEQIVSMQAQLDAVPSVIDMKVGEALAAFKAELKAKYELQQVAETEGEVGFKSFLE